MNIIQKRSFIFSQNRIQNVGGWCYGISAAIITHLRENISGIISPQEAYFHSETYAKMLSASSNKIMKTITPGFRSIRKNIISIQNELDKSFENPGRYIYNFDNFGICLLLVNVDHLQSNYGDAFQGRFACFAGSPNHAGVIVWAPFEVFIFDPNCGGVLFSWSGDNNSVSMPSIIDMMLEQMYCLYDRMKGERKAKVMSCITLEKDFYGRV